MKSPFPKSTYSRNARMYKVLAHPVRLEILNLLKRRELSVDEITKIIGGRKAMISQHLALLRHTQLVSDRREGLSVRYSIVDPSIVEPCRIFHEYWKRKAKARVKKE